MAFFYSLY